ncbi:hypothetical protein TNCV_216731 [Trichonephila clavipes]|nr:hypothetical protein TNCV_216731 [Trichonephila clavipes]
MLPGVRHRSQRCFTAVESFKTTGMCSRRHGEVVLKVRRLQKTDISSYEQKRTGTPQHSSGKSVSCCLRKADLPKNSCQEFQGRRTIRTQTCCVCPIDQTAPYKPVCNGVLSITIGLNRTGQAYYSQMRVGLVCHRIVDAN